ncbi:MAG: hypothetical protein MUC76_11970 [Spirochaetes bacterium]|jgi:hypothetical protein|nr:hypothetical protein [Spirochaetota bacterium]
MEGNLNRDVVTQEAVTLLAHENIIAALQNSAGATPEKEIAVEFINSYLDFIKEIVGHDIERGALRGDLELRDLVAHINSMMQQKDEHIYTTMVMQCPMHYKAVHRHLAHSAGD